MPCGELLGDEGETLSKVVADVAVEEGRTEPLITDVTIDTLGIQVVSFGKGLWRHVNGPKGKKELGRVVPQKSRLA